MSTSRFINEIRELFRDEFSSSRNNRNVSDYDIRCLNQMIASYNENMQLYNHHIMNMIEIYMLIIRSGNNTGSRTGSRTSTGSDSGYRSGIHPGLVPGLGNINRNRTRNTSSQNPYRHLYRNWRTPTSFDINTNANTNFFQNVIVRPTIGQIDHATEEITYSNEQNTRVINTTCPITLEDFVDGDRICRIKHCGHAFKYTELSRWFNMNVHCPVCRYDIRDYVPHSDISNNQTVHSNNEDENDDEYRDLPELISDDSDDNGIGHGGIMNSENAATIANSVSNLIQNYLTNLSSDYNEYTVSFDIPTFMMDLSLNQVD